MRVWRVAHGEHRNPFTRFPSGPYVSSGLPRGVSEEIGEIRWDHNDRNHPGPYDDPELRWIGGNEVCGFDSLAALNSWFEPHWRAKLKDNGFQVYVYEVDEDWARVGSLGQTVFNPNEATLVETAPLATDEENECSGARLAASSRLSG